MITATEAHKVSANFAEALIASTTEMVNRARISMRMDTIERVGSTEEFLDALSKPGLHTVGLSFDSQKLIVRGDTWPVSHIAAGAICGAWNTEGQGNAIALPEIIKDFLESY
jgi:hypothetical protein